MRYPDLILPTYPEKTRAQKVQGRVDLTLLVSETGHVLNAKVAGATGPLEGSALAKTSTWLFKPVEKEGRPIPFVTPVAFEFRIDEREPGSWESGVTRVAPR